MKRFVIVLIKSLHLAILLFVILGWAMPSDLLLKLHIAFVPMMVLQWQFNRGTCFLTNVENWISGERRERGEQQGQFIKGVIIRFIDPLPSDRVIKIALYLILGVAMAISVMRLLAGEVAQQPL